MWLTLILPAAAHRTLVRAAAVLRPPSARAAHRTRNLVAQEGWITGVDQGGQAYYFNEQLGDFRYDPPPVVQQNYGGAVLCRLQGISGVHYWCKYALKNGDVQALSRFNMLNPKVTVSRVQCIVQCHDGVAQLTSCGKGPTLWRTGPADWVALESGDQVPLLDGDLVSLDCNDPEGAVFVCRDEAAMHQGGSHLPYPWQQLVDPQSGDAYYSNPNTGEAQWDPPTSQGGGYPQQVAYPQPDSYSQDDGGYPNQDNYQQWS